MKKGTRPLMTSEETAFARAVSKLGYCNPFLPERVEFEHDALGDEFEGTAAVWHVRANLDVQNPNLPRLGEKTVALTDRLHERLLAGALPSEEEQGLYEDLVIYRLFFRFEDRFAELIDQVEDQDGRTRAPFYGEFVDETRALLSVPGVCAPWREEPAHLFACLFQVRRAFHHTFRQLIGGSLPMARLRAAVWQSIFTHDMRRYRRALFDRMGDITTLITGPSGTGKELVARAIGLSRYIPFDARNRTFTGDPGASFYALNLSALSPTLIESELFGHKRGAFTGALQDRPGWLEVCYPLGAVFLDEIGDLDAAIQVKLLRVLQSRTFQRLGDTAARQFNGKIIAATNRDLPEEIRAGRFREDFYYRLCSDLITTPSLREQLQDSPDDLHNFILFLSRRIAGTEGESVAGDVERWIRGSLPADYPWPGNVRELEQCVRNVLIRREYRPRKMQQSDPQTVFTSAILAGRLTADELLARYCTLVYSQTGSYQETGRRLGLDRRTVKSKVDPEILEALTAAIVKRGG